MARLINDSGVLGDSVKVTAETVKDVPFDKVIESIHKVQENIGITGTTSKEAASTIEGSTASVKAAWDNLMTGIADPENQDIGQLISNFADSLITAMKNSLPRIREIVEGMSEAVKEIWNEVLPELEVQFPELKPVIDKLQWLIDNGPVIAAVIAGVVTAFETFTAVEKAVTIATEIMNGTMMANPIGLIVAAVAGLVVAFMTLWNTSDSFRNFWIGLWDGIKNTVGTVVGAIVGFFTETLPNGIKAMLEFVAMIPIKYWEFLGATIVKVAEFGASIGQKAVEAGSKFLSNIISFISQLPSKIWSVLTNVIGKVGSFAVSLASKGADAAKNLGKNIINGIKHLPKEMLNWGKDMIQGLIDGIKNMIGKVGDAVKGVADKIKGFLHFSRPDEGPLREYEEWMPDMVNGLSSSLKKASPSLIHQTKELAKGVALGIRDYSDMVAKEMEGLERIPKVAPYDWDFGGDYPSGNRGGANGGVGATTNNYTINVNQPVKSVSEMAREIRTESQYGLILEGEPV